MEHFVDKQIDTIYRAEYYQGARFMRYQFEESVDAFTRKLTQCILAVYSALGERPVVGVLVQDFLYITLLRRVIAEDYVALALTPNPGTSGAICCRRSQIPVFVDYVPREEAREFSFDVIVQFSINIAQWELTSELESPRACYGFLGGYTNGQEPSALFVAEQVVNLDENQ